MDEQSAQAHSVLSMTPRNPLTGEELGAPFNVTLDSTITHTPAMLERDQIAHIASTFTIDAADIEKLEPDEAKYLQNILQNFLGYLSSDIDLLENDQVRDTFAIKPFSLKGQKGKQELAYSGLKINAEYNQNDLQNVLYDYAATFRSGRLTVTFHDDVAVGDDGDRDITAEEEAPAATTVTTLEIAPFTGSMKMSEDSADAETSAIDVHLQNKQKPRENVRLHIAALSADGKDLAWDDVLRDFLGTVRLAANGVKIDSAALPVAVAFKTLAFSQEWHQDDGLYRFRTRFHIMPDIDFAALFAVPVPKIDDLSFTITFDRLSGEAIQAMHDSVAVMAMKDKYVAPTVKRKIAASVVELVKNKARGNAALSIATEAGTVRGNITIGLKKDVDLSSDDWQKAFDAVSEENDPEALKQLLSEHAQLQGKIVIPKAILGVIGATALAANMGGPYLKTQGDDYVIDFMIDKGGLRVNDKSVPLEGDWMP